jgi:hypothetical protein
MELNTMGGPPFWATPFSGLLSKPFPSHVIEKHTLSHPIVPSKKIKGPFTGRSTLKGYLAGGAHLPFLSIVESYWQQVPSSKEKFP